jgi:hypothetical protein
LTNFARYLLFFQKFSSLKKISFLFFLLFSLLLFFSPSSLLFSSLLPPSCFFSQTAKLTQQRARTEAEPPCSPPSWSPSPQPCPLCAPPAPLRLPLSGELHMSSHGAPTPAMAASHGEPHTISFFFVGWPKRIHMTSHLLSPRSILSETNSNLWILWDSIFQLNSDFITNSNLNPSGLLPHPYISLGGPPPRIPMSIPPQNQALAATHVPPSPSPLPLFQSPLFKLNRVPVVRSQEPNHRKKNHVETWSVASTIYHRSLTDVSHRAATFTVNLKSIRRYRWVSLAVPSLPDFTDLKSKVYSSSYSKFQWTSDEVPASRLHCCLLPWAPSEFYK